MSRSFGRRKKWIFPLVIPVPKFPVVAVCFEALPLLGFPPLILGNNRDVNVLQADQGYGSGRRKGSENKEAINNVEFAKKSEQLGKVGVFIARAAQKAGCKKSVQASEICSQKQPGPFCSYGDASDAFGMLCRNDSSRPCAKTPQVAISSPAPWSVTARCIG